MDENTKSAGRYKRSFKSGDKMWEFIGDILHSGECIRFSVDLEALEVSYETRDGEPIYVPGTEEEEEIEGEEWANEKGGRADRRG